MSGKSGAMPSSEADDIGRDVHRPSTIDEQVEGVVAAPAGDSLVDAISRIPIKKLPQAFEVSTRLENWLARATVGGDLPFATVGQYADAATSSEDAILRSWGMGRKTARQLTNLIKSIVEAGASSQSLQQFASAVGISENVAVQLLEWGDPNEDVPRTTRHSPLKPSDETTISDAICDLLSSDTFLECVKPLPNSVRLGNALAYFARYRKKSPSLVEFITDPSRWLTAFRRQPNVGRKTVTELSEKLQAIVANRLIVRGLPNADANEVAAWFCSRKSYELSTNLKASTQRVLASPLVAQVQDAPAGRSGPQFDDEAGTAVEKNGEPELLKYMGKILQPRQYEVLSRRFGLENRPAETLEDVALSFDVTRERIRQIEAKALQLCAAPFFIQPFKAFLHRERSTILKVILGTGQAVRYGNALAQAKALDPIHQLSIHVCNGSLEQWLNETLEPVKKGQEILGWIEVVEDAERMAELYEALVDSADDHSSLRDRILSALFDLTLPAELSQVVAKIPGVPSVQIEKYLQHNLGAIVLNGQISNLTEFPTTWRVRKTLKMAGRPLALKEIAALHLKLFGLAIEEHNASGALQRLEDTLIVARGTYSLYEHLPFEKGVIDQVKHFVFRRVKQAGYFVSAKILHKEFVRDVDPMIGAILTKYMIAGFCHDDERFAVRRGLMVGLASDAFEKKFVSLRDSVHHVVEEHGPVRIADIKRHLSATRDVLDISIAQSLKSAPDIVLADRGLYDLTARVIGGKSDTQRLSHALQLALIDHDASIPVLMSRLAAIGIEFELPTIVSFLSSTEIASESGGVFHLEAADDVVSEYNAAFDEAYSDSQDPKEVKSKLSRTFANDSKAKLIKLDYRLKMDPATWDQEQSLTDSKADVLRELLSEFEF